MNAVQLAEKMVTTIFSAPTKWEESSIKQKIEANFKELEKENQNEFGWFYKPPQKEYVINIRSQHSLVNEIIVLLEYYLSSDDEISDEYIKEYKQKEKQLEQDFDEIVQVINKFFDIDPVFVGDYYQENYRNDRGQNGYFQATWELTHVEIFLDIVGAEYDQPQLLYLTIYPKVKY